MSVEFDIQFSTLQEWIIVQTKRPSAISFVYGLVENEIFESNRMRQVKKKNLLLSNGVHVSLAKPINHGARSTYI